MKILYLHQYFKTPIEGGAIRSWHLAKGMVDAGHDVVMITSHNHQKAVTKTIDGIKVHYLPVYYDNKLKFIGRVFSFIKFIFLAYKKNKEEFGVDLCYATSTPLTIGLLAYFIKKGRRIPYVFEVRDLWPEAPIQMGIIKSQFLKSILYKIERLIYANATQIIALSPGIRSGIEKVCKDTEIVVVPNMSDCDFFQPEAKDPQLEKLFNVEEKFVVSYFGAAGPVNKLDNLVSCIRYCKDHSRDDIFFLIQAYGSELKRIESEVEALNWPYVYFLHYSGKDGLKNLLNVTDAVYISFDNKPVLQTNSPNKFFDSIAAGKLCIVNTKGWIKDLIEREGFGMYVNPEVPGDFLKKLNPFIKDRTRLLSVHNRARSIAERYYSKDILVKRLVDTIENCKIIDSSSASEAYNRTA